MDHSGTASSLQGFAVVSRALIKSTRPKQWTKNLLVFLPLFFAVEEAWDPAHFGAAVSVFGKAALAFVVFSMLAGAVYLVNDAIDAERDRLHPRKRHRPIASGQLPASIAWIASVTLVSAALVIAFLLVPQFGMVSAA